MSLAYNVWTEEEILLRNVVPKDKYLFQIVKIEKKKTKGGLDKDGMTKPIRDMLEIDFEFWDDNDVCRKLRDWIVFMDGMDWKLRHLAKSTKTLELYESKELDIQHLLHKKGVFELGVKDYTGSDGLSRKVNFVIDYCENLDSKKPVKQDQFNDRIPF